MPLVNGFTLLKKIFEKKYVACAFNTTNIETSFGIADAIEDTSIPNYIQIAPTNVKLSGYEYIADIIKKIAFDMKTPIALHLDHGKTMEDVEAAVKAGFTSIMIDGSDKSFDENINVVSQAVDYCSCYNIPVEAELGAISGKEDNIDGKNDKTNPGLVKEFIKKSKCNMLAVSVGNVHGLESKPHIDFELLDKIYRNSSVPLVLHGGSGIPFEILKKVKKYGVCKINIASDLRREVVRVYGQAYEKNHMEHNLIKVALDAKLAVYDECKRKILALN